MKTVAVIIPAYKSADFIDQCINSFLCQETLDGYEYKLFIGVDGCKETAEAINTGYYMSDQNVGAYVMRNSLIDICNCDILSLFDADDIMTNNYLKKSLEKIDKTGIVIPKRINMDSDLNIKGASIGKGGACTFTKEIYNSIGGFKSYRCASDTDFLERVKMAGYEITEAPESCYYRRRHSESLTKSINTGMKSEYRKQAWQEMQEQLLTGEYKIEPEIIKLKYVELTTCENQRDESLTPVYILIRTSRRPMFFKNMMDSIKNQTYGNIITIVHTDDPRDDYIEGDIILKGTPYPKTIGNCPYNLYNNRLLESIPDGDGYYMFLDDDDMLTGLDVIEKMVSQCKKEYINVCRVIRWNNEIYPKKWRDCKSFQTECFMLHTNHKLKSKWWANAGGDHYYSGSLIKDHNLPINWIDNVIMAKAQKGKGHGNQLDLNMPFVKFHKNDNITVYYLRDIMSPFHARGKKGETKKIPGNYAEYLKKKGLITIMHDENLQKVKMEL